MLECPECKFETEHYYRCPSYKRNGVSYSCVGYCDNGLVFYCLNEKCNWFYFSPDPDPESWDAKNMGIRPAWINDFE